MRELLSREPSPTDALAYRMNWIISCNVSLRRHGKLSRCGSPVKAPKKLASV